MSEADKENTLTSMIQSIAEKMTDYRSKYMQPLGPLQIPDARRKLIQIQNMVTDLETWWRSYSDEPFIRILKQVEPTKLIDILKDDEEKVPSKLKRAAGESYRKVVRWFGFSQSAGSTEIVALLSITRKGYEIVGQLSSLPSYTSHYSDQCSIFRGTQELNAATAKPESLQMHALMILQIERLRSDVESKQQRIMLLNIHAQTELTTQIRRLNGFLILLTIGVLVVALKLGG
jgi:hypothetical protein